MDSNTDRVQLKSRQQMEVRVAKSPRRKRGDAFSRPPTVLCPSGQFGMTVIKLAAVDSRYAIARSTSIQRMVVRRVLDLTESRCPKKRLNHATKIHAMHGWTVNFLSGASGSLATPLVELASKKLLGRSHRKLQQMVWDVPARPRGPVPVLTTHHARRARIASGVIGKSGAAARVTAMVVRNVASVRF